MIRYKTPSKVFSECMKNMPLVMEKEENITHARSYFPSQAEVEQIAEDMDQEVKADKGKLRLTLVPTEIIRSIARVRQYGVEKYKDPEGWRRIEIERLRDAMLRHILAYIDDPKKQDESGCYHLEHAACNIDFLLELENYYEHDD